MENKAKILVVDDEEPIRKLLKTSLNRLGYEVLLAADGQEALEVVAEEPPDVILTDVRMSRLDGFELCRRLKDSEKTRTIPVVMVTALSELDDRVKALEVGAEDFLSKPVHQAELKARVRSLVKVKAYHDHLRGYQRELELEVAKRTAQLKQALYKNKAASLDTIHRLSHAAEYKDEDTGAHIQRMGNYCVAIGRNLRLNENTLEAIRYAAPMHDVGKIGIPDHILLKPGKLEPDEWETMKQHTTIGAEILSRSDTGFIKLAEIIALSHHEKWDGSGYPKGIKFKEIPLVGRIVAIADVFDALTSKRPYKEPFSLEKSFAIIKESRGSHFDPAVVGAFFAVEDEILSIKEKFLDEDQSLLVRMIRKAV